jgi:hypothetical protein
VFPVAAFPTEVAWPGSGSCQGSPTASRRRKRGLDTSLTPGSFLRHVVNVQVWLGETSKPETKTGATKVMFHADMGSPFRFRCVSWNGRMLLCDLLSSERVHSRNKVNIVPDFQSVRG